MSDQETPQGERLQKVLARAGHGSRREIEGWIRAGEIKVNGDVATLGVRVGPHDRIELRGRKVDSKSLDAPRCQVIAYHKPIGELVARRDPERRPTVFDQIDDPDEGRWIPVGRLDFNTSGLLLLTTDGELANRLMHPSAEIPREYAVRVLGKVTDSVIDSLLNGVELEDGLAKFSRISEASGEGRNQWYRVVLHEGRNREVRRMWESQGVQVSRLIRTAFGPIGLPRTLRAGRWETLPAKLTRQLASAVNLDIQVEYKELRQVRSNKQSRPIRKKRSPSPSRRR